MTNRTRISWTNSTWNPTVGCTKVGPECENCYAESIVENKRYRFGHPFEEIKIHANRLADVRKFKPLKSRTGEGVVPHMVFVNSMSDLFHRDIPDEFRDQVFNAMETAPDTIFQVLTKRAPILRNYIQRRYQLAGVPAHIWLGCSVGFNETRNRLDVLRQLKARVGDFTAFVSVEPIIGPTDRIDFTDIDWSLLGGESGTGARMMEYPWLMSAVEGAEKAGSMIWMKQYGKWPNNPRYSRSNGRLHIDKVRDCIANGERLAEIIKDPKTGKMKIAGEKGGATLDDGRVLHQLPLHWVSLQRELTERQIKGLGKASPATLF